MPFIPVIQVKVCISSVHIVYIVRHWQKCFTVQICCNSLQISNKINVIIIKIYAIAFRLNVSYFKDDLTAKEGMNSFFVLVVYFPNKTDHAHHISTCVCLPTLTVLQDFWHIITPAILKGVQV